MDDLKLYGNNDNEIDSVVKVVKIVPGDIGMQFGVYKCGVLKANTLWGYWFRRWCRDRGGRWRRMQVSRNSKGRWYLSREDERKSSKGIL